MLASMDRDLPPAYRKIVRDLASADEDVRDTALDKLGELDVELDARAALAVLRAALALDYPPPADDWIEPRHDLLFKLVTYPHASLVPVAQAAYARLAPREQCAILALLGAIGTRKAATAFMACVREGWPRVYPRVFTEATKLLPHADVLFPELVDRGGKNLAEVNTLLAAGLASGAIDPRRVALEPIAALIAKSLARALSRAAKHARKRGTLWRSADAYVEPRRDVIGWLELAGHVRAKALGPLLARGLASPDPRIATAAAASILRRGGKVPAHVLERCAASDETRALLFAKLEELGQLARFPARFRTWDAFAVGHMAEWLLSPMELGHEPDAIEQTGVFTHRGLTMHVFRFRPGSGDGTRWLAGIAGPFRRTGRPRPLHGHLTFSRFEAWGKQSAERHLEAILDSVTQIG